MPRSLLCVAGCVVAALVAAPAAGASPFLSSFSRNDTLASTSLPPKNDVNPYGVAVVPRSQGRLERGDVLVSNFNNSSNLQGTGTTIVEVPPSGRARVFADLAGLSSRACPGGVGLTTALVALRGGFVIVGSLPTADGTSATMQAGCLIALDSRGRVVRTIAGGQINGPWDMTAVDGDHSATLFVTNVLNGPVASTTGVVNQGTVVRIELGLEGRGAPRVRSERVIGSGFAERSDPAALVVGPTGVGLARSGTLYVADTALNRIVAIPDALRRQHTAFTGREVSNGGFLDGPLGLAIAPNGDILTANGGDGNVVETTPLGAQVAHVLLDNSEPSPPPSPPPPPGQGALLGLALAPGGTGLYYVDDAQNTLNVFH